MTCATPVAKPKGKPERGKRAVDVQRRIAQAWKIVSDDAWRTVPIGKCGWLLVGLWATLHEKVYGIDPAPSLATGKEWMVAAAAARRVAERFGDVGEAIEFVRWMWAEEAATEKRRRKEAHATTGWRLSWQNLFQRPGRVLDFEAAKKRRAR